MLHPKSAVERSAARSVKFFHAKTMPWPAERIASASNLKVNHCDFGDDLPNTKSLAAARLNVFMTPGIVPGGRAKLRLNE